jgi:type II secretion system protein D
MIGVAISSLALPLGVLVIDPLAAAPKTSRQTAKPVDPEPAEDEEGEPQDPIEAAAAKRGVIRLNYLEATWEKVIKDFAEATETTLVADFIPRKKFSRWDMKRYSKAEALKILNQELQPLNFRLEFKGRYLVLNNLRELRHEYQAAVLKGEPRQVETADSSTGESPAAPARKKRSPAADTGANSASVAKVSRRAGDIQLAGAEAEEDAATKARRAPAGRSSVEPLAEPPSEPIETTVSVKTHKASSVAGRIYRAFGTDAEKTDDGPQGLRGFRVRRLPAAIGAGGVGHRLPVEFSVGIDNSRNELIVSAPPAESKSIVKLVKTLDTVPKTANGAGTTRVMTTRKDAGQLAKALQPELNRLAQATRGSARGAARADDVDADPDRPNAAEDNRPNRRPAVRGQMQDEEADETDGQRALFGSLKGDVLVESVPELGILVIRGNQEDVEAVEKVIEEIERISLLTAPRMKLAILRHISSESLATLLTSVYDRLSGARNSATQQSQAISVFPISRPNALLIVASNADIEGVFALIDELDRRTDPMQEFKVFRLKYAVPSQIVDKVEAMFPAPTAQAPAAGAANQNQNAVSLVPRVRIIDDLRTNSVIVQARPRDMAEVASLIEQLDRDSSDVTQAIKIFPLTSAVADEVAFTLSSSIQNVLGPARATAAPTTGQQGPGGAQQQQQAAQGTGTGAAELREVKSAILEFLDASGEDGRVLRSGILSDIRITADLRTNSIVVTAPKGSMAFVEMLIRTLDKPSPTIAEIKVFRLKNADATSVQTLLERLFGIQRTGQQGGQGGNQQQGVPGVQLVDADDSSSMLVPLRFSVDVRTNSIIAIGGGGALNVVEAVVLQLDESDIRQRKNEVYRLKNAPATNVSTAISQFLQTQQQILTQDPGLLSPFEQIEREVVVVPETTSNSLLISATPRFFDDIFDLIVKLDRTPRQVLIQALIVEVQLTNTDEFGMELGLQDSILFRRSNIPAPVTVNTTQQTNTSTVSIPTIISEAATPGYLFGPAAGLAQPLGNNTFSGATNPNDVGGQGVTGFGTNLTNGQLGYGGLVLQAGSENINFLLRALAVRTRVDVLSRPQIRTLDNQFSQIMVGQEIPRINGFASNGTAGVIVPTVQQRSIGVILNVTPRITPDGLVIMEVIARKDSLSNQQINLGVSAAGTAVTSPIVNTTNAQTSIAVNSGQTVVLGGMITKQDNNEERKVPILGDIPILGRAFRYDLKTMARTELLIFLTPRVITDDEEAECFKQIEIERLNFIESEAERMHGPLYGMPPKYETSTSPSTSGSSQPGSKSTGPSISPNPGAPVRQTPPPPPPGLRSSKSKARSVEPEPVSGDDEVEETDAPLAQANFQTPPKKLAATDDARPAKSNGKSKANGPAKEVVEKGAPGTPVKKKSKRKTKPVVEQVPPDDEP